MCLEDLICLACDLVYGCAQGEQWYVVLEARTAMNDPHAAALSAAAAEACEAAATCCSARQPGWHVADPLSRARPAGAAADDAGGRRVPAARVRWHLGRAHQPAGAPAVRASLHVAPVLTRQRSMWPADILRGCIGACPDENGPQISRPRNMPLVSPVNSATICPNKTHC